MNLTMGFFFANPLGLLGLLALPAIVGIHFLRREPRRVPISTLFLVEASARPQEGGARWHRLRSSRQLWWQLAAACALSLLLAEPRWTRPESVWSVVVVMDDSASMAAFADDARGAVGAALDEGAHFAGKTRYRLLLSDGRTLYRGESRKEFDGALAGWKPRLGPHDPSAAFRLASMSGRPSIVYVTDHLPPSDPPAGVSWVSVGHSIRNAGIAGVRVDPVGGRWSALLRNYSNAAQGSEWWIESAKGESGEYHAVEIPPGGTARAGGLLPAAGEGFTLHLTPDDFPLDDTAPILNPVSKHLAVGVSGPASADLADRLLRALPACEPSGKGEADLTLADYDPLSAKLPGGPAVVFSRDLSPRNKVLQGEISGTRHPLVEGLNWDGLVAADGFGVPARPGDEPLVWQGARPLIFLRESGGGPQLVFNFDPAQSNLAKLPAFPVLVHRFTETIRARKVAFSADNVDADQALAIAGTEEQKAPTEAGFFDVRGPGGEILFRGAAQFSQVVEADLSACAPYRGALAASGDDRIAHSGDHLAGPLLALAFLGFALLSWSPRMR